MEGGDGGLTSERQRGGGKRKKGLPVLAFDRKSSVQGLVNKAHPLIFSPHYCVVY